MGCKGCKNYYHFSDYEYPLDDEVGCDKYPQYANLTSFPFKKEMKCFEEEIWPTEEEIQEMMKRGEEDNERNQIANMG